MKKFFKFILSCAPAGESISIFMYDDSSGESHKVSVNFGQRFLIPLSHSGTVTQFIKSEETMGNKVNLNAFVLIGSEEELPVSCSKLARSILFYSDCVRLSSERSIGDVMNDMVKNVSSIVKQEFYDFIKDVVIDSTLLNGEFSDDQKEEILQFKSMVPMGIEPYCSYDFSAL